VLKELPKSSMLVVGQADSFVTQHAACVTSSIASVAKLRAMPACLQPMVQVLGPLWCMQVTRQ